MTGLLEWQKRVGLQKADEIRDEAGRLGTLVHTHMECHIQGIPRPGGNNLIRQMATRMSDVLIKEGLVNVSEVWGFEVPLYFPELYAGTTDLVGIHKGKPAIMDYKNTRTMKKKETITDYFCQCAAYALAHNFHYGTDIETIVIFMVARDNSYKEFVVTGDEFYHFASKWQDRILQYERTGGPRMIAEGTKVETHTAIANVG